MSPRAKRPELHAFFAKGMCCQRRDRRAGPRGDDELVDKARFNKGVKLNALTQVVTVAVKDETKVTAVKVIIQRAAMTPLRCISWSTVS